MVVFWGCVLRFWFGVFRCSSGFGLVDEEVFGLDDVLWVVCCDEGIDLVCCWIEWVVGVGRMNDDGNGWFEIGCNSEFEGVLLVVFFWDFWGV